MKRIDNNNTGGLVFTRRFVLVAYFVLYFLFLVLVFFDFPSELNSDPLKLIVHLLGVPALGAGSTFLFFICPGLLIFYGRQNRDPYKIWAGVFLYLLFGLIIWVGRQQ